MRQHVVADAVPRIAQICIGLVLDPGLPERGEVLAQLTSRGLEQRSNHQTALRIDGPKARPAGAAGQLEHERLRLIVERVADSNPGRVQLDGRGVEECIPRVASRILDRTPVLGRKSFDVCSRDKDRQTEPRREIAAERLVPCGGLAQLMIDVRNAGNGELERVSQTAKQKRQRDRVGATREADEHTSARRAEGVPSNGAADVLDDSQFPTSNFQLPWQ
jgi:hypothetical protein